MQHKVWKSIKISLSSVKPRFLKCCQGGAWLHIATSNTCYHWITITNFFICDSLDVVNAAEDYLILGLLSDGRILVQMAVIYG